MNTRRALADASLTVAALTHAHWFFGNLYEAVVKVPHRVAASEDTPVLRRTPLGPGSPGRYYAPLAPVAFPAVALALAAGWNRAGSRPWLVTAAAASATGGAATAYLLRSVNPALFFRPYPLSEMRRTPLLAKWYRINALRLAASAVALAAIDRARTASLIPGSTPGGQTPPMYKRATAG